MALVSPEPPCTTTSFCPAFTSAARSSVTRSKLTPLVPPILTTIMCVFLLDGVQPRKLQRRGLVQSAQQVEGLDGRAGGALHQIINGGQRHDAMRLRVELKAHIYVVRAAEYLRIGDAVDAR